MKKVLNILLASFVSILTVSCKKDATDITADIEYPEFSFTYNGQTFSGMNNCELLMTNGSRLEGVGINKEDVFGGKIFFYSQAFNPSAPFNNCAFLQPTGTLIAMNLPGCLLTNFNGSHIDSSRVFIYNSGSISTVYTNCKHKTDPFTNIQYEECTVTGSFSLVIGNNSGQTKYITGSFKFFNIRK